MKRPRPFFTFIVAFIAAFVVALSASLSSPVQAHAGDFSAPPLRFSISIALDGGNSTGELPSCDEWTAQAKPQREKPTFWQELLGVTEASLIFSGLDFLYFNTLNGNKQSLGYYRAFQGILQTALSVWLFYRFGGPEQWEEGLKVASAFNLLWWTGNDDLIYYGMAELFSKGNARGFAHEGSFKNDSDPSGWAMRHFWWTPLGLGQLIAGVPKDEVHFTREMIWGQAGAGFAGAMTLLLLDFWKNDPEAKTALSHLNQKLLQLTEQAHDSPELQASLISACRTGNPVAQNTLTQQKSASHFIESLKRMEMNPRGPVQGLESLFPNGITLKD